jgi:hypothetical protein
MYLYQVEPLASGPYPYHSRPPFVVTTTLKLGVHGLLRPTCLAVAVKMADPRRPFS